MNLSEMLQEQDTDFFTAVTGKEVIGTDGNMRNHSQTT